MLNVIAMNETLVPFRGTQKTTNSLLCYRLLVMYVLSLKARIDAILRGDVLIFNEVYEMLDQCFEANVFLTFAACKSDT